MFKKCHFGTLNSKAFKNVTQGGGIFRFVFVFEVTGCTPIALFVSYERPKMRFPTSELFPNKHSFSSCSYYEPGKPKVLCCMMGIFNIPNISKRLTLETPYIYCTLHEHLLIMNFAPSNNVPRNNPYMSLLIIISLSICAEFATQDPVNELLRWKQ